MRKAFKFRIFPTKAQHRRLEDTLELCRLLYNAGLEQRKTAYKRCGISLSKHSQQAELPSLKADASEFGGVYSQVLQDVLARLDKAFQAFFRRVKAGGKPGYPRFKAKGRYDSFTYPQLGFALKDGRLQLSKIGSVKIRLHREILGTINTLTLRRTSTGKWFACCSVECEVPTFGLIVFEALLIRNMLKHHTLAKSIADAAWSQLVQYTTYKAEGAGGRVMLVDPRHTSQDCSACSTCVQKSLAERMHRCPQCGLVLDRDVNAALNILALGLQSVRASVRSPWL